MESIGAIWRPRSQVVLWEPRLHMKLVSFVHSKCIGLYNSFVCLCMFMGVLAGLINCGNSFGGNVRRGPSLAEELFGALSTTAAGSSSVAAQDC